MEYPTKTKSEPKSQLQDNFDELVDSAIIVEQHNYDDDKDYDNWEDAEWKREHARNILASSVSSIVSRTACHPLDAIKLQLQRRPVPTNMTASCHTFHVARLIHVEKGFRGFYKDHGTAQFANLLQSITLFWTYENLRVELNFISGVAHHSQICNFAAGFISGATTVLALQPLVTIKIRQNAHRQMKHHFQTSVPKLFTFGEWRTFYRGVVPNLVHVSPLYGCKFYFYHLICEQFLSMTKTSNQDQLEGHSLAAAGALSGVVSNGIVYPLDVIKQRLLSGTLERQQFKFDSTCRHFIQCYKAIIQREGFLGLYNGLLPCMLRSAINTAVQFSIFEKVRFWALNRI